MKAPKTVSRLYSGRSLDGSETTLEVVANDNGAQWVQLERVTASGRRYTLPLPIRQAGAVGLALVGYADRKAVEADNARAEAGK